MIAQRCFAMIFEEEVKNVIVCEDYPMANYLAKATYGADAFAIDVTQCPCYPGCTYVEKVFRDTKGDVILFYPTTEEEVEVLKEENTNLQLALTEQYETNSKLQDEVSNTQLALTELYEMKGV